MFIIALTYTAPLEQVEQHLAAYRQFLDKHYQSGAFLFSGRKEPRTGGIIVARAASRAEIERIIGEDPFHQAGIADYEIPSNKTCGVCWARSCSPGNNSNNRPAPYPVGRKPAWHSPPWYHPGQTCYCSTSPQTTSTPSPGNKYSKPSAPTPARLSWSPTTPARCGPSNRNG